jgi:hypothetical protein
MDVHETHAVLAENLPDEEAAVAMAGVAFAAEDRCAVFTREREEALDRHLELWACRHAAVDGMPGVVIHILIGRPPSEAVTKERVPGLDLPKSRLELATVRPGRHPRVWV